MTSLDERALLGALLSLSTVEATAARELFDRNDLDDARHRIIVDLIDQCLASDVRPDPAAVFAAARTSATVTGDHLGQLGALLADLHTAVAHPAWVHIYATGVVEASTRRRLRQASERLEQAADSTDLATAMSVATTEIQALAVCIGRIRQGASA